MSRKNWSWLCVVSVAALLLPAVSAQGASSTWLTPTSYPSDNTPPWPDWNDASHWTASVIPNGVGDVATFSNLTDRLNFRITDFSNGAANPGNATTITLGGITHTGAGRLDSRPYGPVSTIVWDNGGSNAFINTAYNGEFLLAHNHVLTSTLEILNKNGGQTRLSRLVSGPGGFILSGGQEFVLGEINTPNTFLGGVTLGANTRLDMRKHAAMGTGALTFASTANAGTAMTPRGTWSGAFPNDIVVDGIGRIREESSGTARTFSGDISGNGSLTIEHKASDWQFTGAHTGTGSLTTQGTGTVTFSGATDYDGDISIGTGSTLKYDSSVNQEVTGEIFGGGALVKSGSGTLSLIPGGNVYDGQPNTFTGGTTLEAGTLRIAAKGTNALGTGPFTIQGGTIELAGNNVQTMNNSHYNLNGDFSVVCNGGHTLTLGTANGGNVTLGATNTVTLVNGWTTATLGINGTIDDGGNGYGLIKDGAGTLKLSGTNTYTGKTIILSGTLAAGSAFSDIGVAGPLGAPTGANAIIDIYNGATLAYRGPQGTVSTNRPINLAGSGPGTWTISANGNDTTLALNGAITATATGPMTLDLRLGDAGNGDRERLTVVNAGIPNASDGSPLSLNVTCRTQTGSQSYVTLNGVNTFTGSTRLEQTSGGSTGYFTLGASGGMLFDIGASGVNNKLYAVGSRPWVVNLDGDFAFDLTGAGTTSGDMWQIVDTSGGLLTANYGGTFDVMGFTADAGGDLWTLNSGGTNYEFSELTGVLSVLAPTGADIPEPATMLALFAGLAGLGRYVRRRSKSRF